MAYFRIFVMMILNLMIAGTIMAIEEPTYQVEEKKPNYEIRIYEDFIVAETIIESSFEDASSQCFRRLFDYISGNNTTSKKLAMTAPVIQSQGSKLAMTAPVSQIKTAQGYKVQFVMPKEFTMQTIPQPNDPRVIMVEVPKRRVAIHRYSGSWSKEHYQQKVGLLLEVLKKDGFVVQGDPILSRYNPPFWPWFLRRNEIWIALE